jgi:hypothetical protein
MSVAKVIEITATGLPATRLSICYRVRLVSAS